MRPPIPGDPAFVGGGSVALDTARALKRLGSDVLCACLESGDAVPAPAGEIKEMTEEGIELMEGVSPVQVLADFFTVKGIEMKKVARIDVDAVGRIKPVTVDGSEFTIECDSVVFATGQKPAVKAIAEGGDLKMTENGRIAFDADTFATSTKNVFVAGDLVEARGSVISAMASGRKAALSIDNLLQGRSLVNRAAKRNPQLAPMSEAVDVFVHQLAASKETQEELIKAWYFEAYEADKI